MMIRAVMAAQRLGRAAVFALACATVPAAADEDVLWARLAAQEAASGHFEQELYDEEGALIERSSGSYAVLKPGYFRWEITAPDRQLLLVSGDTLWHYDIDLATATRRQTHRDNAFAPLELLGGDTETLRERFVVSDLGDGAWRLEPTYAGAGFAAVELQWQGETLTAMRVVDRSGQRMELALQSDASVSLSPENFSLTLPDDVEVYYDDGA